MDKRSRFKSIVFALDMTGNVINKIARYFILICIGTMVPIVIIQIFRRYLFGSSFPWVEELARYLFIWATFIGSAIAIREKGHVAIEALINLLPESIRRKVKILVEISMAGLFLLFIVTGTKQVTLAWTQWASSIQISMGWVYLSLPVSGAIMFYHTIVSMLKLTSPENENNKD